MNAQTRRSDAANVPVTLPRVTAEGLWLEAASIRQEWLAVGLSTEPAGRAIAERSLSAIYARLGRAAPRFEWVDSPATARPLISDLPTLDDLFRRIREPVPIGPPPLAAEVATLVATLRGRLQSGLHHPDPETTPYRRNATRNESWPVLPPLDALRAGVPFGLVLHRGVREALLRSFREGIRKPLQDKLSADGPLPLAWYGGQDASWIGYYDALERLGLARYATSDRTHLDEWAMLARSSGWWWPGAEVCVVVDRPLELRTEPVPRAWHGEIRLQPGGIRYRDGWPPVV